MELNALERHEFHDGEILAMAGTTYDHSLIASNLIREIGNALKGKPCRVADSNLRIRTGPSPGYVYPDASVICGPPLFDPQDSRQMTITNPRVIVEVLSPSTEGYDRGDKFTAYRQLQSLEEYVLVSQSAALVESFYRQADSTWSFAVFSGREGTAKVRSLGIELAMSEVYAGVQWPAVESVAEEAMPG